jgi:hypothetical protein
MATDNTPPRLRLIATIAVIVVITLIGIDFVLKGYYAMMTDEAQREKLAPLTARDDQRKVEAASLAGAAVPLDQAMAQLKTSRGDLIEPKPSDDMGAMTGWAKLPKALPLAAPGGGHVDMPMSADAGAAMADGGAGMMAGDAGAMMPPNGGAADSGAPQPKRGGGAGAKDAGH